jgi:hypothetical protein
LPAAHFERNETQGDLGDGTLVPERLNHVAERKSEPRNQDRQGSQSGQNNRHVKSSHAPLVRLNPVDFSASEWAPFHGTKQSIAFHAMILTDRRPRRRATKNFPEKQIYRLSLKSWKIQET